MGHDKAQYRNTQSLRADARMVGNTQLESGTVCTSVSKTVARDTCLSINTFTGSCPMHMLLFCPPTGSLVLAQCTCYFFVHQQVHWFWPNAHVTFLSINRFTGSCPMHRLSFCPTTRSLVLAQCTCYIYIYIKVSAECSRTK